MRLPTRPSPGFTLLELMIAITILSILMLIGVPSFRDMAARNRISGQANQMLTLLTLARSEAIQRNRSVVVCTVSAISPTACEANPDWANGVLVFVDINGNDGVYTPPTSTPPAATDDLLLRVDVPFGSGSTVVYNGAGNRVAYQPTGLTAAGGTWEIRPRNMTVPDPDTMVKRVRLSLNGRPRVE